MEKSQQPSPLQAAAQAALLQEHHCRNAEPIVPSSSSSSTSAQRLSPPLSLQQHLMSKRPTNCGRGSGSQPQKGGQQRKASSCLNPALVDEFFILHHVLHPHLDSSALSSVVVLPLPFSCLFDALERFRMATTNIPVVSQNTAGERNREVGEEGVSGPCYHGVQEARMELQRALSNCLRGGVVHSKDDREEEHITRREVSLRQSVEAFIAANPSEIQSMTPSTTLEIDVRGGTTTSTTSDADPIVAAFFSSVAKVVSQKRNQALLSKAPSQLSSSSSYLSKRCYTQNTMDEIVPGIYCGSYHPAADRSVLLQHGITHILCCINVTPRFASSGEFQYMVLPAEDSANYNISQHFLKTNAFITEALTSATSLVQGVSTTPPPPPVSVVATGNRSASGSSSPTKTGSNTGSSSPIMSPQPTDTNLVSRRMRNGTAVLVHCGAGISRAPTVVCAYLIATLGMSYCEMIRSKSRKTCLFCRKMIKKEKGKANLVPSCRPQ